VPVLPDFSQSLLNFYNVIYLVLIYVLLYDSLNLVIMWFSFGLLAAIE